MPHLSLLDYPFEGDVFEYILRDACVELRVLPIDKLGKNFTVGMVNPLDVKARERIRELCPELRIKPILCAYSHYKKVMEKFLGEDDEGGGAQEMSLADYGFATPDADKEEPKEKATPVAPEEPVAVEPVEAEPIEVEPIEEAAVAEEIPLSVPEVNPAEPALDGETILGAIMSDDTEDAAEEPSLSEVDASQPADVMEEMLSVMRDTYAVLARRMPLFRGLNSEEVAKIFASGMTAEHDVGATIFEKGDQSDELHVVLSGKVDVVDEGRKVASIEAGWLLGVMAWISDEPRSAVAVEATSLITLSDDVFENLVSKEASIQQLMNIIL
ncbi:MAG TPA: cyclic nucleotide-binding domain-containing protein, partial [Gammaproteobacteria bacterium]|nr:cyclic nucleotide-binding domain-containing protein [Gammaproteobacteria bacterium]